MKWFRVYDDIIDDPKILRLSLEFRWFYVGILSISSRQSVRGNLPDVADIALHLRISEARTRKVLDTLMTAGFIDQDPQGKGLRVHGWDSRQFKSDDVTQRWREHKRRKGANVGANVGANGAQTDQIQNRYRTEPPYPPDGGGDGGDISEEVTVTTVTSRGGHDEVTAMSRDAVVDFGRKTMGDRFDLEHLGQKLSGWRAANYPDAWIMDAILVANCKAEINGTASFINGCLRRWKKQGGPDPGEVPRVRPYAEPTPEYVQASERSSIYPPGHPANKPKGKTA